MHFIWYTLIVQYIQTYLLEIKLCMAIAIVPQKTVTLFKLKNWKINKINCSKELIKLNFGFCEKVCLESKTGKSRYGHFCNQGFIVVLNGSTVSWKPVFK